MKNQIIVKDICANKNRINCKYEILGNWSKYFDSHFYYAEYNIDISDVPDSVLVLPFLCDIMPLAWICDADIIVDEIDKDFFDSLSNIKAGFSEMYPMLSFRGRVQAEKIVKHSYTNKNKSAMFFSGGVDAHSTLISNYKEKPSLITVWGSDIALSDEKGWLNKKRHVKQVGEAFGLSNVFVESNFKKIFNHRKINEFIKKSKETWWHGFQHGLGILGLAAPYAYKEELDKIFIASTYSAKDNITKRTCASDPTIDNHLRFCGARAIHDGFELNRQDKYDIICKYSEDNDIPVHLHVCWLASGAVNCCNCEKCFRTIFGIILKGYEPTEYGFGYHDVDIPKMVKKINQNIIIDSLHATFWNDIQQTYIDQNIENPKLEWLRGLEFDKLNFEKRSLIKKFYMRVLQAAKIYFYKIKAK